MLFTNNFIYLNLNNLIYQSNNQIFIFLEIEELNQNPNFHYHFVKTQLTHLKQLPKSILLKKKILYSCIDSSKRISENQKDKS